METAGALNESQNPVHRIDCCNCQKREMHLALAQRFNPKRIHSGPQGGCVPAQVCLTPGRMGSNR
jgi:hypothetical protein